MLVLPEPGLTGPLVWGTDAGCWRGSVEDKGSPIVSSRENLQIIAGVFLSNSLWEITTVQFMKHGKL